MSSFKKSDLTAISLRYPELTELVTMLNSILNRGITFNDNVDCRIISYTSNVVANTQDTVPHSLGKLPVGFLVRRINKAGIVYDGGTTWTNANIYLKCSVAVAAVEIIVF